MSYLSGADTDAAGGLISTDGPHDNVLKIKPPPTFGIGEAELLLGALEAALRGV